MNNENFEYISKYTGFQAFERPYTDTFYYKRGNDTIVIIHVDNDWNMFGEVLDPFLLPISPIEPIYGLLTQQRCEELIMRTMPPPYRKDVLRKYNMKKMDYAMLMYCTRLINLIDTHWMAWSENDKAEDYHPRFNKELMKEREKYMVKLDPEPEDILPSTPYFTFTEKDTMFYSEENIDNKFKDYAFL